MGVSAASLVNHSVGYLNNNESAIAALQLYKQAIQIKFNM